MNIHTIPNANKTYIDFADPYSRAEAVYRLVADVEGHDADLLRHIRIVRGTVQTTINMFLHALCRAMIANELTDYSKQQQYEQFIIAIANTIAVTRIGDAPVPERPATVGPDRQPTNKPNRRRITVEDNETAKLTNDPNGPAARTKRRSAGQRRIVNSQQKANEANDNGPVSEGGTL